MIHKSAVQRMKPEDRGPPKADSEPFRRLESDSLGRDSPSKTKRRACQRPAYCEGQEDFVDAMCAYEFVQLPLRSTSLALAGCSLLGLC